MGTLKGLNDVTKNAHLLFTSSNLAEIYVYDTLKKRCSATLESIYTVDNQRVYKDMLELVNIQPNLAESWLFVLEYNKIKSLLKKSLGIFQSSTSVFLIKVNSYNDFKEVKDLGISVNDLYLENIKKPEVMDLLREFNISPKIKDFIATSYYREPDKVFSLYNELKNGVTVETFKDVSKLCGESTGSIQRFVIQLLTDNPKSEMFLKRSYKKRLGVVYDLCDTFNPKTSYNYIKASVKDILYIKMLYLNGVIYDRIYNLPDCFDEKRLVKYSFYLKSIANDISYDRILFLYNAMTTFGRWNSSQDGVLFLYKYYLELLKKNESRVS